MLEFAMGFATLCKQREGEGKMKKNQESDN